MKVDNAIRSGAMTRAIQHAGLTNASATKPAIPRDITPSTPTPSSSSSSEAKEKAGAGSGTGVDQAVKPSNPSSSPSTVVVEYTQIIDRFSVAG